MGSGKWGGRAGLLSARASVPHPLTFSPGFRFAGVTSRSEELVMREACSDKRSCARRTLPVAAAALTLAFFAAQGGAAMSLSIGSTTFTHQGEIPRQYTCEGQDKSPPLTWSGVPEGARSLVLIVDDPDAPDPKAPKTTWVHWVLYNLPPDSKGLPEAIKSDA